MSTPEPVGLDEATQPVVDEELALRAFRVQRARQQLHTLGVLSVTLVLGFAVLDGVMAPGHVGLLALLRLANAALTGSIVVLAMPRVQSLGGVRRVGFAFALIFTLTVAPMFAFVGDHFWPMLFLYSLSLWASSVLGTPPLADGLAMVAILVAGFLISALAAHRPTVDVLMGSFVLVALATVTVAVMVIRRRLEHRAFRANFALERRTRELTAALVGLGQAQARLVAAEKMGALGRLLAGLAHELNNPVNVIQNNVAMAREYLDRLLAVLRASRELESQLPDGGASLRALREQLDEPFAEEDFGDALLMVEQAVERINEVQRNLRTFVRGAAPSGDWGDLNQGLRSTVALIRQSTPAGVEIVERYDELPRMRARWDELNQACFNVIQNALDAVGLEGRVEVSTHRTDEAVFVSVTDDGPGVPPEAMAHIFEPFFTTKDVGEGLGMGLAMAYEIIRQHRGRLLLEPVAPRGTRVTVRLPVEARMKLQKAS